MNGRDIELRLVASFGPGLIQSIDFLAPNELDKVVFIVSIFSAMLLNEIWVLTKKSFLEIFNNGLPGLDDSFLVFCRHCRRPRRNLEVQRCYLKRPIEDVTHKKHVQDQRSKNK